MEATHAGDGVGHGERVAFSPDGAVVAVLGSSRSGPGRIELWDAARNSLLSSVVLPGFSFSGLRFSRDGRVVFCRSNAAAQLGVWAWEANR